MDRDHWSKILADAEKELGFKDGYKFVYGPWATLDRAEVAFLSLNPAGKVPDNADMRTVSDERGNSYEVERLTTKSPITDQFLRLAQFLGHKPRDILTGVAAPFRSDGWKALTREQKLKSLALGRRFWTIPLLRPELRLVIACSQEAAKLAADIIRAPLDLEASAGWGIIKLRRYRSADGKVIVQLPHLSRFKLLGRESSERALRSVLDGA